MDNRSTILVLGIAQFVMVLDSTVMNVSISQVVKDLHTSVPSVQTAITLYTLVMAAFMLTGAKLGDVWTRRRAFRIGLVVYGLGSLTTARPQHHRIDDRMVGHRGFRRDPRDPGDRSADRDELCGPG